MSDIIKTESIEEKLDRINEQLMYMSGLILGLASRLNVIGPEGAAEIVTEQNFRHYEINGKKYVTPIKEA